MAVEYYYFDNFDDDYDDDEDDDNFVSDLMDLIDTEVDNIFATNNFVDYIADMVFSDNYLC